MRAGRPLGNQIGIKSPPRIEEIMLKEVFAQVTALQKRIAAGLGCKAGRGTERDLDGEEGVFGPESTRSKVLGTHAPMSTSTRIVHFL